MGYNRSMNINKKYTREMAGTTYFVLNEASLAAFGFNVATLFGQKVTQVDLMKTTAGNPRRVVVHFENGGAKELTCNNLHLKMDVDITFA